MADNPPRLLQGYGANPPRPNWIASNGKPARLAVQFVINYEEGGENCLLNGDKQSEWLLSEIVGATPYEGVRHMNMESLTNTGLEGILAIASDVHRTKDALSFAVARALELNPQVAKAMVEAD